MLPTTMDPVLTVNLYQEIDVFPSYYVDVVIEI